VRDGSAAAGARHLTPVAAQQRASAVAFVDQGRQTGKAAGVSAPSEAPETRRTGPSALTFGVS